MDLDSYQNKLELEGKSQHTITQYRYTVNRFLKFVDKNPKEVSEDDVMNFLTKLKKEGVSLRSIARHFYAIKDFLFHQGVEINWKKVSRPSINWSEIPKIFSKDEIESLAKSADLKLKTIIKLAYECALRVGEVASLKIKDVDFEKGELKLFSPEKRGEPLRIPIENSTLTLIRKYLKKRGAYEREDPLFLSRKGGFYSSIHVSRLFKKLCKELNIEGNFHMLRHSRATHLLKEGLDLSYVNKLLRHKRLDTTAIYLHLTTEDLREKLNELKGD